MACIKFQKTGRRSGGWRFSRCCICIQIKNSWPAVNYTATLKLCGYAESNGKSDNLRNLSATTDTEKDKLSVAQYSNRPPSWYMAKTWRRECTTSVAVGQHGYDAVYFGRWYQHLGEDSSFHIQHTSSLSPADRGGTFLRNVGTHLPDFTIHIVDDRNTTLTRQTSYPLTKLLGLHTPWTSYTMLYYVEYDTIFVNRNWVSIRWQWTVNLYTNRKKKTTIYMRTDNTTTIQKHRKHKIERKKTYKSRKQTQNK